MHLLTSILLLSIGAISLRPLHEGQNIDEHRMTSSYADWVTNAKLPNGVENVKKHLQEVDNVPLLVSLFTDVTKCTTSEMVRRRFNHHLNFYFVSHDDAILGYR